MPKTKIALLILVLLLIAIPGLADTNLSQKLSGRILLQVEENGEAWYINPLDYKRYFLSRPLDAFNIMRELGFGITNENLKKIRVGLMQYQDNDSDKDGLADRFEEALGTDINNPDTDNDGYTDALELEYDFDPLSTDDLPLDDQLLESLKGKIFLQVEGNGEAWYINPIDGRRYYLGRPLDAFTAMRQLGLGISNENLKQISIKEKPEPNPMPDPIPPAPLPSPQNTEKSSPRQTLDNAASAIRANNKELTASFFIADLQNSINYTMDSLSLESKLILGNILSGAQSKYQLEENAEFIKPSFFGLNDSDFDWSIKLEKQENNDWLISQL